MKKGNLLLLIITLLIIAIVGVFALIAGTRKNPEEKPPSIVTNEETKFKNVINRREYYIIENCVNKFYKYYASIYADKNPQEANLAKTYNLLDEKYINFKDITVENLATSLPEINDVEVTIYNMYTSVQNDEITIYLIEGILREEKSNELLNFKLMVQIDSKNGTFSILLEDYIEANFPDAGLSTNINFEVINSITLNKNNQYIIEEVSDESHVINLINRYKEEAIYNTKLAYEHIDDEYKTAKFGSLEKFQQYVKENQSLISNIEVEKYLVTNEEGYTQYVCIDKKGYCYIIRETEILQYTIILDVYTINLPEFIEKYNEANTVEKVGYNIQKCLEAINCKDYSYVYNKLDFEFKAVNYPTLENFEKEIKTKLFARNEVKTVSSLNEGSTYVYKLTIANVEDSTKEQKMTVIMQLKEGTDFVMSLSFSN